ncbi:RNA polymerase factor sigma-54 [Halobacillus sp. Nhm2S1]|uniref:RNA polymerase factor sigma-54 n=1 Tax=Halobacillus sp. Nhm2S1 TaxID=2866716 RepID=UPI001C7323E2|nr:RNA polymerase factor sigma-54 [Halobacillus sp. Nhm2S1]MBX0358175.1 RNA polymerase factor sigma-54 [Halobacillus sp. Nhm2S1]
MKLELTHKQTTGLVMTTQMRQAITMLQWTSAELWEYIQQEIHENPILTLETPSVIPSNRNHREAYHDPIDQMVPDEKNWREGLVEQAGWLKVDLSLKEALLFLIGNLDERGFCTISEEEAALQTGHPLNLVKRARRLLLQFEPMGVGCMNFKEFLLLQVDKKHPDSSVLSVLIEHHLEDLAAQNFKKVACELDIDEACVVEAMVAIQSLEPRPLLPDSGQHDIPAMPDLILEKKDGGYVLRDPFSVNGQIQWDEQLVQMYKEGKDAQDYLDDCYKKARWLLQSIEQRQNTILKVAEMIIKHQRGFLNGGSLRPLTLKKVAEKLDVHESTISRTVANKVMQTPKGIYELKSFFVTGYQSADGGEVSSQHIKTLIREMIQKENPLKALSDQKMATELKEKHNVKVSRRTVAKYRESLNLPSSSKRRASAQEGGSPILLHS